MNWFANILDVAIGPVRGRTIDFTPPKWLIAVAVLTFGLALGWLLYKLTSPSYNEITEKDLLWLILFSIWWTRK